jgi:hypothetical protein
MQNGNDTLKKRRLIIRVALVVFWICLGVLIFIMNRGHTVLLDNHSLEAENIRAPDMIKVSLDGGKALEFFRGDRDIFEVGGGNHRIRIEFSDGTPPFEGKFALDLMPDMFLLSIPRMINNIEPFIEVFQSEPQSRDVEEEELANGQEGFEEPAGFARSYQ